MSFTFRPARLEHAGLFIALAGGTNSGKTYSALRVARGIAGPGGKIAALDTEAGRMSHYAGEFQFDVMDMAPPFRPERFADAAKAAEEAGYAVFVVDSFSMEWVGPGGVLDWADQEFQRMGGREAVKLASWIKPKSAHKAMVYSFLQRRIPIVFALRAEEKVEKEGNNIKKRWEPICNKAFPFELTLSFMLSGEAKGHVDLSLPHKMEGAHRFIFQDGDLICEEHGAKLAAWARGVATEPPPVSADPARKWADNVITTLGEMQSGPELMALIDKPVTRTNRDALKEKRPDLSAEVEAAFSAAYSRLVPATEFAPARLENAGDDVGAAA